MPPGTDTSPEINTLENRQAVLDEINALLASSGRIDEARAKRVRKALDSLRSSDGEDAAGEEAQLDTEIDARLKKLRSRVNRQVERGNRDHEKALGLADAMEQALQANELHRAEEAQKKLRSLLNNIPGRSGQRWKDIEKRLQRAQPQIRKLESWRHWGTTQARQKLIEQVRQLTQAGLPPGELAKSIQQARDQWHTWDKGGDHAGKHLWKDFDQACEEAYRPCIAHFEKLKEQRAKNLARRQDIIDRLNERFDATDWKHPDWRDIDRFVHQARRDFYKIGNVDYRHRKPTARALDEAIEKFETYLSMERSRSLKARERLIADIEALGEVEDLRDALNRLDGLKRQWQITVVEKQNVENRLWKRFQAACKKTYDRRDAERKDQHAERTHNLKQKEALIGELQQAVKAGDGQLLANASLLSKARTRWEEIGWVPRKLERGLNNRWSDAQKQFRSALQAAQSRSHARELDNLYRRAALCHRWEQQVLAGGDVEPKAASTEWDALPALAGHHAGPIEQRYSRALDRAGEDTLSENLAIKQDACLKLEVILNLESPEEYQAQRMQYQIVRLNASMKKDPAAQDSAEDLLLTALTTGAVPPDAAEAIEQRLRACFERYSGES